LGVTPARLHVVTALASPMAVVLRRGPAGKVASLGWNRDTGAVVPGQWLAGRIYEYRCDLSPDGRHLVYFATRQSRAAGHTAWTALSRAPWLRAVQFAPQEGTWGGGGAFTAEGALWSGLQAPLGDGLAAAPRSAFPASTDGVFQGGTHGATLVLRGWRHLGGQSYDACLARDLPGGGVMRHRYVLHGANRAIASSAYDLTVPGQDTVATDWEWADLWRDRLHYAAGGALWQIALGTDGRQGAPTLVHDFNAMTFQALQAPYDKATP
jgi:hypothetical protein